MTSFCIVKLINFNELATIKVKGKIFQQLWKYYFIEVKSYWKAIRNFTKFELQGEAETSSGGDQLVRNNLANRNEEGANHAPDSNLHFEKPMPKKNSKQHPL